MEIRLVTLSRRLKRLANKWMRGEEKSSKRDSRVSRRASLEAFEPRKLLTASPIWVGGVYIEEDSGSDQHGDTFHISFRGGAAGTVLTRLVIDGDQGTPGFNVGDNFFDIADGGYGADHSFGFQIEQLVTANPNARVNAIVQDGSTKLVLEFENFQAGDLLVFSIDVDEVEGFDPNETDLAIINSSFDPITSGVEFQTSKFQAEFQAPHYEDISGTSSYLNLYDVVVDPAGLDLPRDDENGKRDRSAGTAVSLQQIAKPVWIEGVVYEDFNQNLSQDPNDLGIANVRLELWRKEGSTYINTGLTANTNSQGAYKFGLDLRLAPGTYQVREVQPAGYFSVGATPGFVDTRSTGQIVVGDKDILTEIEIPLGDTFATKLNFAEARPASISGHVCVAKPGKDCFSTIPGDLEPLANVRIDLLDSAGTVIATTQTAADGSYRFDNLKAGNYSVVEHTPGNLIDGGARAGTVGGANTGSVIDSNRIGNISLVSGSLGQDFDFCELPPASLSGHVYEDVNDDGLRQASERLLAGVTIELIDTQGNRVAQTTTDNNGFYQFTFLRAGNYKIRETTPAGFIDGKDRAGTINGQTVGQVDSALDTISEVNLPSGMQGIDYDFGELRNGEISGRVIADTNDNCIIDADGDQPLANVLVQLLDGSGNVLSETRTDLDGRYKFTGLRPGTYAVREVQPAGYFQGDHKAGSGGGNVSTPDLISQIVLNSGDQLIDYDFCEIPPASIAGFVHVDNNGDCIIQPNERMLAGVQIELLDVSGNVVQTTTTGSDGSYKFTQLRPGTYSVREIQPAGLFQGGQRAGSHGGNDSVEDIISSVVIPSGQSLTDYNFCEIEPASIAGFVHVDSNGDCLIQPNEQMLAGVRIELLDSHGNVVQTATTGANGSYSFANLRPSTYSVREIQPQGYFQGGQRAGSNGGDVSVEDIISSVVIPAGQTLTDYNFCEIEPASIAGKVYSDVDGDCTQDPEDQPLVGVKIQLFDESGNVVQTTFTDASGTYKFSGLRPARYTVRETQPDGFFQGGQKAPHAGIDTTVQDVISKIDLGSGQSLTDLDFCERPPAKISGYVFQDGSVILTDDGEIPDRLRPIRDGQLTGDDIRISNVTLELRLLTGRLVRSSDALPGAYSTEFVRVQTDANGYFEFGGLKAGTYHIYQIQPEGYVDGLDTPGTMGGQSVNPEDISIGSAEEQFVLQLASSGNDPKNDAILRVNLDYGQHAQANNFSEVLVGKNELQGPSPSGNPPTFTPPQTTGITSPPFERGAPANGPGPSFVPALLGGGVEQPYTWHLSVINSGKPRGERADKAVNQERVARATVILDVTHWTVAGMRQGNWSIVSTAPKVGRLVKGAFNVLGAKAQAGDFNGDGHDELALYYEGEWLIDINGNGEWDPSDLWARLGTSEDEPVVGDWDGDGKDDIGIFGPEWEGDQQMIDSEPGLPDPANKRVTKPKNLPPEENNTPDRQRVMQHTARGQGRADVVDHVFQFGLKKDQAISGDFNGDGISTVGVFRNGRWQLDVDGDGQFTERDKTNEFGKPGDMAVVGDFNGDGIDEIAVVRGNQVIVDSNNNGKLDVTDKVFELEATDGQVIIGDFDGDGTDEPAVHRNTAEVPLQARRAG
jgi:serine-aspartate repeat-containing protein C/D/E